MYWYYRKLIYKIIVNRGGYRITYFMTSCCKIALSCVCIYMCVWLGRSADYLLLACSSVAVMITDDIHYFQASPSSDPFLSFWRSKSCSTLGSPVGQLHENASRIATWPGFARRYADGPVYMTFKGCLSTACYNGVAAHRLQPPAPHI